MEIIKYPYNEKGTNVPDELHTLTRSTKFILPRGGCYFGNSLTIVEANTLTSLKRDIDYELGNFNQTASIEVGGGIYGSIFFKRELEGNIKLDISYIGGEHSLDVVGAGTLLDRINARGGKVLWDDIIKPDDGILPKDHFHLGDDLKGTQDLTAAILTLSEVIANATGPGKNEVDKTWLENRLDTTVKEVFSGNFQLTDEQLDGNTVVMVGIAGVTSLLAPVGQSSKKPVIIYNGGDHVCSLLFDPAHMVLNAELPANHRLTLRKGVTTLTPLGQNLFLVM